MRSFRLLLLVGIITGFEIAGGSTLIFIGRKTERFMGSEEV
jgi:hypothetical protein